MQSFTPESIRHSVFHIIFMLVIGSLVALFIGLGVNAFYPQKEIPQYPRSTVKSVPAPNEDPQFQAEMTQYDADYAVWEKENRVYSRNVGLIVAVLSVVALAAGLLLAPFSALLGDGVLLGGAISMFYAIIRANGSNDPRAQFIVVTIALVSVMIVAYIKFVRQAERAA